MADKTAGDTVAPQVFYFAPHNKWCLIDQWGDKYSTNTDISTPDTWTTSQGELIRSGYDKKLEIDSCNMQFLYQHQRFDPAAVVPGSNYPYLPYRLGLLKPKG